MPCERALASKRGGGGLQVVWVDGGVSPVLGFYLGVLVLFQSWSGCSSPGDCFQWTCGVSSSPALTGDVMLQVWVLWDNDLSEFDESRDIIESLGDDKIMVEKKNIYYWD
ncbi:hypothetical protein LOK49_LG03G02925 [Camellia lanceoleosa]|uniref:Uncharacterized protein n=1 Tax=Camellia lanceoleosa TaxID=1840588 RepID=A0ACC0I8Q5_9ERIC|nr:hypothetical protein LOK49_LG03G02925 [Camellia lanceoleosa]